jgi:hypothetical protein
VKKRWWKSKTLWFNTAAAIGTVVEANFGVLQASLGPKVYVIGMGAVAGVNFMLRFATSQPIVEEKKP